MRLFTLAALSLALAACGGSDSQPQPGPPPAGTPLPPPVVGPGPTPPPSPYPAGLSAASLTINGTSRAFLVHMPARSPRAIVLVLHGGGGNALNAANGSPLSRFRTVADREGFVVIYPDSANGNWNDCRADAPGVDEGVDDTGFFDALLTRLEREFGLGPSAIFVAGHSNGAMMSFRYAFERSNRIAAIATSAGQLPQNPEPGLCTSGPQRAVPALMTMGTADTIMPYAGGCIPGTPACSRGRVLSAEATRDRWLQVNALAGVAPVIAPVERDANDGGPAVEHRYVGASPVHWWRLDGAGHRVPSRTILQDPDSGPQNRDVEFAEIAWSFFDERLR